MQTTSSKKKREVNDHVRFTEKTLSESLRQAARHHIESFDFAVQECLPRICNNLLATEISAAQLEQSAASSAQRQGGSGVVPQYPFRKMTIWFENLTLKKPVRSDHGSSSLMSLSHSTTTTNVADADKIYPSECRLRSLTYSAPLYATVARKIDQEPEEKLTICLDRKCVV